MNRIIAAVQRAQEKVDSKGLTPEQIETHSKSLNMDITEYCTFQEVKSLAQASGKLTHEEAQTVYCYLGNSPETFNDQPIAVKYTLTALFQQLLSWKLSLKHRAPMFAEAT